jgi:lipid-binding SYLF domain-containing protein
MPTRSIKTPVCWSLPCLLLLLTLPSWGADKNKDEEILKKAGEVLQAMFHSGAAPTGLLITANCILILPHVKQFAVGVGKNGGRGPLLCRKGKNFSGKEWSAPAMYSFGGATVGLQLGGSSTDFVTLILSPSAANKLLTGKTKVGKSDISTTVGAETSTGWVADTDVMAFGHSKGLFAGTSLSGASLESDSSADQHLYNTAVSARDIVLEDAVKPTPAGQSLILLLQRVGQFHSHSL